jgi:F0F1-type ATP synthase membrane subunit c/vacuolar-type H+-ATPase subunit K
MARQAGDGVVETATEARQGFRDRPVLVVLVASTALIAVLFAMLWAFST